MPSWWRESKVCDVVTVSEQLDRLGKLQDAGGLAYLGTLARDTPTAANVRAYAQIVRERALLRALVSVGSAIASSVFSDDGMSARDLVNQAEQRVFEIAERGTRRSDGAQVGAHHAAGADRQDRRLACQSRQDARHRHRLHGFRPTRPAACAAATW